MGEKVRRTAERLRHLADRLGVRRLPLAITAAVAVMIAVFVLGYLFGTAGHAPGTPRDDDHAHLAEKETTEREAIFWTCSMHPQIKKPGPGKCPICGMDLIPVYPDAKDDPGMQLGERQVRLSREARRLAEVQTSPVERRPVEVKIRMVGRIEHDETRLAHITAWIGGRLDDLFVDFTGVSVKRGDHMVWLYSPEAYAAQEELFQAIIAAREISQSEIESMRQTADATIEAAREKLRLWGLTAEQIDAIERRGTASDHIMINAPIGGTVVEKHAVEGMYVSTGMRIYTIADLSRVWLMLDAYESDLPWIRYGQAVAFETETYPGEFFEGRVAFVDPVLDARSRTVKLRVNVPNPGGRLKPGMFARSLVRAGVAEGGRVVSPDLAGKWICPMHPETVKDEAGTCDVCGMPLVSAESLGYVSAKEAKLPLVVPASAPLITGERAVVYVAVPDRNGVFEGREIVLGPRAGDYYVVREHLEEGEMVVTNGNFKIDSAIQILARKSMMTPEGGGPAPGHQHGGTPDSAPAAPHEDHAPEAKPPASGGHEGHRTDGASRYESQPGHLSATSPQGLMSPSNVR